MPIQDTLEFRSDDFRRVVAGASTEWLRQQEVIATRKETLSSFGVGAGVGGAVATGGISVLFAAYKTRSAYVAHKKLKIIEAELRKRSVELHKFSKTKDFLGPIAIGTVSVAVGAEVTGLFDSVTGIDQIGVPDDVLPSTGLLDNPGEAARGAGGAIERIFDSITGDTSTAAAIATTDAVAYHAGMVQVETIAQEMGQTVAETLLFAPGEPSPECKRSAGLDGLSCDKCKAKITQGQYWHCCDCRDDNYDICDGCYRNNIRCRDSKHALKKFQTPGRTDFIDRISKTPGYGLWKPKTFKAELLQSYLFSCNFCRAEVRQGKVFHCFECGTFDLCDECYLLGKRCDGRHSLAAGLCAIDISDCPGYYLRNLPVSRDSNPCICANCKKSANQGTFYRCCSCEDGSGSSPYSLCHDCYVSGHRCKQPGQHVLFLYLVSNGAFPTKYPSTCRRKGLTRTFKNGGACSRCKDYITEGSFFHCCRCPGGGGPDDFDICMRCYRGGRHCYDTDHLLTRHYIKR
ncbi:hypothetical protein F5B22DRAFT_592087 [Xylaria bambusicola]|uniref:uncharacterized protein n=1 Tax=Xylaria bambusicola TaxID=326684 RepID=UPI002008D665|nr:uncharacterized protein F5B22DRAFT_592087 [Xylaria bambusicola]KAI0523801.1 hypothetical protein F5B22DRAFT_592087 [Xylaria bambusicola]